MSKKVALLFAGQGAQTVGMGHDLAEQFPTAAELFQQADEVLERKLSEIAWRGPIEELTKTSNCQPALFVHGLVCLSILRELGGEFPIGGAAGLAKEHGIRRAMLLNVAGAYHSRLMESAYEKLGAVLLHVAVRPPRFPVISNVTGAEVKTPIEIRRTLQDQVTGTVRWLDCIERLARLGCDFFVELGPGGVLAGLLRRTSKGANVISVADADSVRRCVERLA